MEIFVTIVLALLICFMGAMPIAGALTGLTEWEKYEPPPRPVLDRDAPLEWSEKEPDPRIAIEMARAADLGAALLRESAS